MKTKLRNREEIAQWMVSIYQDAFLGKYTQEQLLKCFDRVYQSRDWKRLTQRDREYIRGYARCYDVMVIQRTLTESGSWVTMPNGSEVYFGVRERLGLSTEKLNGMYPQLAEYGIHRYIYEHKVPGKAGIYWVDDRDEAGAFREAGKGAWNGKYPFFIPKEEK